MELLEKILCDRFSKKPNSQFYPSQELNCITKV